MRCTELRELLHAVSSGESEVAWNVSGAPLANDDTVMVTSDGGGFGEVHRWDAALLQWQWSGEVTHPEVIDWGEWNDRMAHRLERIPHAILHRLPDVAELPVANMDLGEYEYRRIVSPYRGQLNRILSFVHNEWGGDPVWCDAPLNWTPPLPMLEDEPELEGDNFSRPAPVIVLVQGQRWLPYLAMI